MTHMRLSFRCSLSLFVLASLAAFSAAQSQYGSVAISAHITPTGGRPEPVRQFTFYVLTRSYADVIKDITATDPKPSRDEFIDKLKCSPELKKWLKDHDIMDLTSPDFDKIVTTDDIMNVSEFFDAYQRSNGGGVTAGLPKPKYRESDQQNNPAKYQKQKDEFMAATRKFIDSHAFTVQGMQTELTGVNPKTPWDKLQADYKHRIAQIAPDTAQMKYLARKTETDLEGRALVGNLPPGNYWISSLAMDASSGDRRLLWDVPVAVQPGQTTSIELSNLNGTDPRAGSNP